MYIVTKNDIKLSSKSEIAIVQFGPFPRYKYIKFKLEILEISLFKLPQHSSRELDWERAERQLKK